MKDRKKYQISSLVQLFVGTAIIILTILIGSFLFFRWDLTSEKRHTLSQSTIELVEGLEDIIYIKVYLKGEYPAEFKRLEQAVREKLDEMRAYGKENIQYEFINPSESPDAKTREEIYIHLTEQGLSYTNIRIKKNEGFEEKIIFPGAIVTYRNRDLPLQLLKSQERLADAEMINNSINNLEYELTSVIRQLVARNKPNIAFIEGHAELTALEVADLSNSLREYYTVNRIKIDGQLGSLDKADAVIIAKPSRAFDEKDKFILDQFIMRGGKVLWLIDPMLAAMDSLEDGNTMSISQDLNLDDQLFQYGVRLNRNLLIDRSCAPIALVDGYYGNRPNYRMFPWYFQPVIISRNAHPITNNVDPILTEFVSSLDTVGESKTRKTFLLTTSAYTRVLRAPVRINLSIVNIDPDFPNNNSPYQPIAALLEGTFYSVYKNRIPSTLEHNPEFSFRDSSRSTKMIVIADGDIAKNPIKKDEEVYFALGYDKYAKRKVYGNREFLLNAINYLLDDTDMINVRSRSVKLRQLDPEKIVAERTFWQAVNLSVPVICILLLGVLFISLRKKKYTN